VLGELEQPPSATAAPHTTTQEDEACVAPARGFATTLVKARNRCNPSLTLENTGSVARDHLASERTFLAYVRTSLTITGAGIALVQLFTISSKSSQNLQKFTRPLGATIVITGLFTLLIGINRYFSIQDALTKGHYPVARLTVAFLAVVLAAIVVIVFGILVSTA